MSREYITGRTNNESIKVAPFDTPYEVVYQSKHYGEGRLPIEFVSANTLSDLCDRFRAEVFAMAGKEDPLNPKARP